MIWLTSELSRQSFFSLKFAVVVYFSLNGTVKVGTNDWELMVKAPQVSTSPTLEVVTEVVRVVGAALTWSWGEAVTVGVASSMPISGAKAGASPNRRNCRRSTAWLCEGVLILLLCVGIDGDG